MMIKVANGFLDFNDLIEVEKQIKLFEDISTTDGDFSYAFDLAKTLNNTRLLGNPMPDNISKSVYQKIPAKFLSDSGAETYDGYIRIERIVDVYQCSFFAGNNNWFGMLSDPLSDLDFSQYDIDQTETTIQAAIFNTEGVVFPLVDNGALDTRSFRLMKVEDFIAGIFVKTVFDKIFSRHGIKIQGELLQDVNYLNAITLSNGKSQEDIDANSAFVQKTTTTARPGENVRYKMTFQNDSSDPYLNGGGFNLSTNTFTAAVKMRVDIVANFKAAIIDDSYNNRIYLYINGVFTFVDIGLEAGGLYNSANPGDDEIFTLKRTIILEAGDTLEVYTEWQQSTGSTQNDVLSGDIKITPTFLYKAFGNKIVPNWTQQEYVSNILRLFNVLAYYHEASQTLTLNLFQKIKDKPPIDLSEYITETEVDYSEFIADYGKKSLLSFKELEQDKFRVTKFAYEKGQILVNNDFLNDSEDILESDFSNPIGYINPAFDMSMERTNLLTVETSESLEIIGVAAQAVTNDALFTTLVGNISSGDLIRISESNNTLYNGDWMIIFLSAPYVIGPDTRIDFTVKGLKFDTNAEGKVSRLTTKYSESGDVFLFHQVPLYLVSNFSGHADIYVENTPLSYMGLSFFNLLNTGRHVNRDFINSLSFSGESNPLHYQQTLIDQYFRLFGQILNDPVKLKCTAHLPYDVYCRIDFLSPVMVRTIETTNLYYLNRITGYIESYLPCLMELIKL